MEKLLESLKGVQMGRYELRLKELNYLYDAFHHDTFRLIGAAFKLGFARGQRAQKAVKKA